MTMPCAVYSGPLCPCILQAASDAEALIHVTASADMQQTHIRSCRISTSATPESYGDIVWSTMSGKMTDIGSNFELYENGACELSSQVQLHDCSIRMILNEILLIVVVICLFSILRICLCNDCQFQALMVTVCYRLLHSSRAVQSPSLPFLQTYRFSFGKYSLPRSQNNSSLGALLTVLVTSCW